MQQDKQQDKLTVAQLKSNDNRKKRNVLTYAGVIPLLMVFIESIVKAIMDSHHREYGVENVEDGVEFWFTLDAKA